MASARSSKVLLPEAHESLKSIPGYAGCILDAKRDIIGVRVLKTCLDRAELCRAIGITKTPSGSLKYRISDIPLYLATKGQMQLIIQGRPGTDFSWPSATIMFLQYDRDTRANYAVIRAEAPPPLFDIQLDDRHTSSIQDISKPEKEAPKRAVQIGEVRAPPVLVPSKAITSVVKSSKPAGADAGEEEDEDEDLMSDGHSRADA